MATNTNDLASAWAVRWQLH